MEEFAPPSYYPRWKVDSLALIDPAIGAILEPGITHSRVDLTEVVWGRVRLDGIPPLEQPPNFYVPENDPRAIYYDYFTSDEVMFPVWNRNVTFDPKEVVVGLSIADSSKAYRVTDLQQARLVNDTLGGVNIVIVASPESRAGRIYERGDTTFALPPADEPDIPPSVLVDETGASWQITETGLINNSDSSETLPRIPSLTSFWLGWFQYHPDTEIYRPASP